jgi:hypothetical protein
MIQSTKESQEIKGNGKLHYQTESVITRSMGIVAMANSVFSLFVLR